MHGRYAKLTCSFLLIQIQPCARFRSSNAEIPDIGATSKSFDTAGWGNSMSVRGGELVLIAGTVSGT